MREHRAGFLVTFEGGEGAGKSTQVTMLARRLTDRGRRVVTTREPGGSPRAELIRDFLLRGEARAFGPLAEAMLFAAARADHVAETVRPALETGAIVLCDRFVDSTRVYQGRLAAVPAETLRGLESLAVGPTRIDLTVVLDLPAELGLARAEARRARLGARPDRFEEEGLAYHDAIRRGFLDIAAAEPERCVVVDAALPPERVAEAIWAEIDGRLVGLANGG